MSAHHFRMRRSTPAGRARSKAPVTMDPLNLEATDADILPSTLIEFAYRRLHSDIVGGRLVWCLKNR